MPTTHLPQASYRGATAPFPNTDIAYYHGIAYSQPFNRFESPKPVLTTPPAIIGTKEDDVVDATHFGPIHPQNPSKLEPFIYGPWPTPPDGGEQNERACGVLSVYSPVGAEGGGLLPVVVYAHGGAWQTGSSQIAWYTGVALAHEANCVVVTINYRLGVLGFLYQHQDSGSTEQQLACGNADHILALEWVRDNIRHFGGDAGNVTAAGQSAGAYNTQMLLDLRPDLFRRAVIMSSPADRAFAPEDAAKVTETVRERLGKAGKTLGSANTAELLAAQAAATQAHARLTAQFAPVIASGVQPGGQHKVQSPSERKDVLITWMQHDGSAFAALSQGPEKTTGIDKLSQNITCELFKDPSTRLAQRLHEAGHNVTTLELRWVAEGFGFGATHCVDLPLMLGDSWAWRQSPMMGSAGEGEWERRGRSLRRAWGVFVREGRVSGVGDGLGVEGAGVKRY